jgi:putative glutathione S-transferase
MTEKPKGDIYKFANEDGKFERQISSFRDRISTEEGARFPPEKGRYVGHAFPLSI